MRGAPIHQRESSRAAPCRATRPAPSLAETFHIFRIVRQVARQPLHCPRKIPSQVVTGGRAPRGRPRRAASRLSRTRTDFVIRLVLASRSSSARRSSGSFNEIVCIDFMVIRAVVARNTVSLLLKESNRTQIPADQPGSAQTLATDNFACFPTIKIANHKPRHNI